MDHISKHPEHAAIVNEINEIAAARGKVEARIAEIEAGDRANANESSETHVAAALKFAESGVTEVPTARQLELEILRKQSWALDLALRDRHATLNGKIGEISRAVSIEVADQHREIASRYLATLRKLDSIAEEETQLLLGLQKKGYDPAFPQRVDWPAIGRLDQQSQSAVWYKARDLANYTRK